MNRALIKIISISMIIAVLMSSCVLASESDAAGEIQSRGVTILNAIMWFGYAIALGMVVFIGIKYMLGAADQKANMKSAIASWLIGAFIVFMATTIVGWVLNMIGADNADSNDLATDIVDAAKEFTN